MTTQPNTYRSGPDERGHFGIFGGRYVAETLMPLMHEVHNAYEAAKATLDYAMNDLNIKKIVAITSPQNDKSKRLLERLGLKLVDEIKESEYGVSLLFSIEKK